MTRPKFTPGPWTIEQPGPEVCSFPTLEIYGGSRIALVHGNGKLTSGADARLIAAAPDMFEALADCIVSLCAANLEHLPSLAKARAALSKAEGTDAS